MKSEDEVAPTTVIDMDWDKRGEKRGRDGLTPSFLYVEKGPGAGQLLPIPAGKLVIGRATVSDLRLEHPSVSRRHAQLTRVANRFYARDLGSQNGTFVNRVRIATEVEVHPGDELQIGAALVRLRGPVAPAEAPTVAEMPRVSDPSTSGALNELEDSHRGSFTRVALLALGVGFGLATVLYYALSNLPTSPNVRTLNDDDEAETAPVVPAAKPPIAKAKAPDQAGDPPSSESEKSAKVDQAIRRAMEERGTAPSDKKPKPEEEPSLSKTRAATLAKYEAGDVTAALVLAREADDTALVAKLMKFDSLYQAATRAVKTNDGTAAIKNFDAALKLDEQISKGWSRYGEEIRKELSSLLTLAGAQHLQNEDPEAARKAFRTALSHDPHNSKAKAQLSKLNAARSSEADKAFEEDDDDPQPKSGRAHKTKGRAAEIDAAFDD